MFQSHVIGGMVDQSSCMNDSTEAFNSACSLEVTLENEDLTYTQFIYRCCHTGFPRIHVGLTGVVSNGHVSLRRFFAFRLSFHVHFSTSLTYIATPQSPFHHTPSRTEYNITILFRNSRRILLTQKKKKTNVLGNVKKLIPSKPTTCSQSYRVHTHTHIYTHIHT